MNNQVTLQFNKSTGNIYEGGNQAELLKQKEDNGYKSNAWLTYVQARTMNLKLVNAKGKGVHLRTFITDRDKQGEEIKKPIHFVVFNEDLTIKL